MKTYLVIGFYNDQRQTFCDEVPGTSPADALSKLFRRPTMKAHLGVLDIVAVMHDGQLVWDMRDFDKWVEAENNKEDEN